MAYPNKKCTFANRVVRRSKSQNISALALSLNRYHKSATPPFYSDIQSDTSFLIIRSKDTIFFLIHQIFTPLFLLFAEKNNDKTIVIYRQVDFSLSTSRFAAIDKSILRNFKMQVKLIYGHVAHVAHVAHIVLKIYICIIIIFIILIHTF